MSNGVARLQSKTINLEILVRILDWAEQINVKSSMPLYTGHYKSRWLLQVPKLEIYKFHGKIIKLTCHDAPRYSRVLVVDDWLCDSSLRLNLIGSLFERLCFLSWDLFAGNRSHGKLKSTWLRLIFLKRNTEFSGLLLEGPVNNENCDQWRLSSECGVQHLWKQL